jgi:Zn-dependent alcohol dehydrogenase
MKITAAVVPIRSAPFEIETLDLAAPLADEVIVWVVAPGGPSAAAGVVPS